MFETKVHKTKSFYAKKCLKEQQKKTTKSKGFSHPNQKNTFKPNYVLQRLPGPNPCFFTWFFHLENLHPKSSYLENEVNEVNEVADEEPGLFVTKSGELDVYVPEGATEKKAPEAGSTLFVAVLECLFAALFLLYAVLLVSCS